MADEIEALLVAIAEVMRLFHSAADWGMKSDTIFALHRRAVRPALEALSLEVDWCKCNSTQEDDVRAYVSALESLRDRVLALQAPAEGSSEVCDACGGLGAIRITEEDGVRRSNDPWRRCTNPHS